MSFAIFKGYFHLLLSTELWTCNHQNMAAAPKSSSRWEIDYVAHWQSTARVLSCHTISSRKGLCSQSQLNIQPYNTHTYADAVKEDKSKAEASEGVEQQQAFPELPYHRFSNGDGILVVSTLPNGELPKADPSQASISVLHHSLLSCWHSVQVPILQAASATALLPSLSCSGNFRRHLHVITTLAAVQALKGSGIMH